MCSFCDIQNAAPINIFSDDEIERIVIGVYSGLITPQSLDLVTYQKVAEKLTNGVYNGFGKSLTDVAWNSPDYTMLNNLRNNVYVFSGAKQYHQVREMVDAIYDKDRIKPFSEYKKTGTDIFKNYNENYLRAEYNAAISQSRSASMWMDIESNKELLPMLEYVTVGDGRVRPEHAMLDRIKRPVDDKFWNNYFPPNGWNCRCTTLQSDDTDKTSLKGFTQPKTVPPEFMMNAGKDKIVFSDKHPYFKVAKQDENLAANNFNMPKPRMEMPKMPEPVKVNEFVPAKNVKEGKEKIKNIIESNSPIKVKNITFSSDLTIDSLNNRLKTIDSLFKEYNVTPVLNKEFETDIKLRSQGKYYGVVKSETRESVKLHEINFGHRSDLNGRIYREYDRFTRNKSRVDEKNIEIATTVHEFAHVIGMERQSKLIGAPQEFKGFFSELNIIRNEYRNELWQHSTIAINEALLNEISLGKYAQTNIDEFMAEGFAEYKLSSNPSKYAVKIGELIDKNFKK